MKKFETKILKAETISKDFNADLFRSQIEEIIAGTHNYLDDEKLANYDTIFREGQEPYFINIWNRKEGSGLGYIVFHNFLLKVGQDNTFSSTNFTDDGKKLFQKAIDDGLIKQTSEKPDVGGITRWKVIGDSINNLDKIKNETVCPNL